MAKVIPNYIQPQLFIRQLLDITEGVPVERINAVIIGPEYRLRIYSTDEDVIDQDADYGVTFDFNPGPDGQILPYTYDLEGVTTALPENHVVDEETVRLFSEGLEARLAEFDTVVNLNSYNVFVQDFDNTDILQIRRGIDTDPANSVESNRFFGGSPLLSNLEGRPLQPGDKVLTDRGDGQYYERNIVKLIGKKIPSETNLGTPSLPAGGNLTSNPVNNLGANTVLNSTDNPTSSPSGHAITPDFSSFDGLIKGSLILEGGQRIYGETFILTCTKGGLPRYTTDQGAVGINESGAEFQLTTGSGKYFAQQIFGRLDEVSTATPDLIYDAGLATYANSVEYVSGTTYKMYLTSGAGLSAGQVLILEEGTSPPAGNLANHLGVYRIVSVGAFVTPGTDDFITVENISGNGALDNVAANHADLTTPGNNYSLRVVTAGNYTLADTTAPANIAAITIDPILATAIDELCSTVLDIDLGTADINAGDVWKISVEGSYNRLSGTPAGQLTVDQVLAGEEYTGPLDTNYLIEVIRGSSADFNGAIVRVVDQNNVDTPNDVTVVDGTAFTLGGLGYNVNFEFDSTNGVPQVGLRAGDIYAVEAIAVSESTTEFDRIQLDGPAVNTTLFPDVTQTFDTKFRLPLGVGYEILQSATSVYNEDLPSTYAFLPGENADGVAVRSGLQVNIPERINDEWADLADGVGKLFLNYRAVDPTFIDDGLGTVRSRDDIVEKLCHGDERQLDQDNDLAWGAYMALLGAQTRAVYFLRTADVTQQAFSDSLEKIEKTDLVYALCPMTNDVDIQLDVADHCVAMSAPEIKNFRRCYISTESPGQYVVAGEEQVLRVEVSQSSGENILVQAVGDAFFTQLKEGTVLPTDFLLELNKVFYPIDSILSDTELLLASPGTSTEVLTPTNAKIWRTDTADSQRDFVAEKSQRFNNRRAANVWVELPTTSINGEIVRVPVKYVAAEIAGLRSAVLPQQGLTRTEILNSISDAPRMFNRYTIDQLNYIAARGTFVITQEVENGPMFIRHQLTTRVDGGNLFYEDSVGVNLDNISFQIKDALDGFIGKRNVNERTINDIRSTVGDILTISTVSELTVEKIGPPLNSFEDLEVFVDDVFKDRINVTARVFIPLPLNTIDVTLRASVTL
jgi:hypothetical protein